MKTIAFAVMATFVFISQGSQALAADTFPWDVWEEMTAWEQSRLESPDPDVEAYSEPEPPRFKRVEMVPLTFPFDVQKELDALEGTDWHRLDLNQTTHRSMDKGGATHSWLP